MTFRDICEYANKKEELPRYAKLADKSAYYAMLYLIECFKNKIIAEEEAKKQKGIIDKLYCELSYNESRVFDTYARQQENIRAAESDISALIKSVNPDADYKELFLRAMDIVSKLEGHQSSVYRKQLENKVYPNNNNGVK